MQRGFGGKKKKKAKKSEDEPSEFEDEVEEPMPESVPESVPEPEPVVEDKPDFSAATAAQPAQSVSSDLFGAFNVGTSNIVTNAADQDHKPPIVEDTIEGRYAGVLFTSASQQDALYDILEDLLYLKGLYDNSETFYLFT